MHKHIIDIMERFAALDIASLELTQEGFSLRLQKTADDMPAQKVAPTSAAPSTLNAPSEPTMAEEAACVAGAFFAVRSPLVGIFYSKPSPEAAAFVTIGDAVQKGDVLCVVEAMKNFNEIQSPVNGIVAKKHFEDDDMVQFDDVLFEIEETC